jgi:CRISPR-associated protein Cas1
MLSFGYTLLTSRMTAAVQTVGFDPYIGYLHSTQYGHPALALDLVEMFRAPIVDSVVLTLINNRMVTLDDFETQMGSCRMTDEMRKRFLQKFEERLQETITHPYLKTKATYERCLELQTRLLSRWMLGELRRFREFHMR